MSVVTPVYNGQRYLDECIQMTGSDLVRRELLIVPDSIRSIGRHLKTLMQNRRLMRSARHARNLKLHLGCGPHVLPGWLNVDRAGGPGVVAMKLPRDLKQFRTASVQLIYASHMFEHMAYPQEVLDLSSECWRVLVPNGALRIVVPGIERIIRAYAADDELFFEKQRAFHPAWCTTRLEHLMYALQQDGEHKYGYDFITLSKVLRHAGFTRIVASDFRASEVEALRLDYRGEGVSLFVDAYK